MTSSIQTITVGTGITPVQLALADFTTGQEFHFAPKSMTLCRFYNLLYYFKTNINFKQVICKKTEKY